MRTIYTFSKLIVIALLVLAVLSCAKEEKIDNPAVKEKAELKLWVSFTSLQRQLAELSKPEDMINDHGKGLKNVGLYVYYTDNYSRGDLVNPYVRNLECTITDGELQAILQPGDNPIDSRIFIYDEMTVVAFYPYNPSAEEFKTKADEELYPITKADYSEQYYIPYRAQTETDPTKAYYAQLTFHPKHTYKIELVVVSDDVNSFPSTASLKILPNIDKIDNTNLADDDKRAAWFDEVISRDDTGGGSSVRQYVAYIWTKNGRSNNNQIKKGDILMESDKLTLIASQDIGVVEQFVYRYGYNMSTGEIFIPTSSNLIHDRASLSDFDGSDWTGYQVCDIDLSSSDWTPISVVGGKDDYGRYDGGGHKITDMTINSTDSEVGLFGKVQGNATICNVNLINPTVTVNNTTADTCFVGALIGKVNTTLSQADINKYLESFPPDLSLVVKQELLKELLASLLNSQSNIVSCRVENPIITVNGNNPYVGTIAGQAGEKKGANGYYKSRIWDTYSLGGVISINAGNEAKNENGYAGGFVGLNNGYINRSYATINNILFQKLEGTPTPAPVDRYTGFTTMGTQLTPAEGGSIEDSFCTLTDPNASVKQLSTSWPAGWVMYQDKWPIYTMGWLASPANSFWYSEGSAPAIYPTLQWERR